MAVYSDGSKSFGSCLPVHLSVGVAVYDYSVEVVAFHVRSPVLAISWVEGRAWVGHGNGKGSFF